jgi:hypothetical protein
MLAEVAGREGVKIEDELTGSGCNEGALKPMEELDRCMRGEAIGADAEVDGLSGVVLGDGSEVAGEDGLNLVCNYLQNFQKEKWK